MARSEKADATGTTTLVGTPARLFRATMLVAGLFLIGTLGYRVVEGAPWWDAFYMTIITITTVGFGEQFVLSPAGEALTVVLLVAGLGIFFFLASEIGRSVMEGELRHYLGRVRRSRMIERMKDHEIVCGYGRMGGAVVDELRHASRQVVVVDSGTVLMQELAETGVPTVVGDATLEATLLSANVQNACGLVSCLSNDAHNVYAVLTARTLNPALFIVARATEEGVERRILQAGANRVVNPYHLGGARLAHLVVKPAIINFFDASVDGSDLQLDQSSFGASNSVVGQTLAEANVRQRWGLGVVAVQRDTEVVANPADDFRLQAGDVLLVFGSRQQIERSTTNVGRVLRGRSAAGWRRPGAWPPRRRPAAAGQSS